MDGCMLGLRFAPEETGCSVVQVPLALSSATWCCYLAMISLWFVPFPFSICR